MLNEFAHIKKNNRFLNTLVFLLGVFLHQSARTNLGNISVSDLLLVVLLIFMFVNKKMYISKSYLLVIVFFLSFIFFNSIFYSQVAFSIAIEGTRFVVEVIKLLVLFSFLLLGMNLAKKEYINNLLGVYSYTAVTIALLGIASSLIRIPLLNDLLFKYGSRLNGMMNDPNYFAVLQITALPYIFKNNYMKKTAKFFYIAIIIFSVLLSGSKTGIMVLSIYLLFLYFEKSILYSKSKSARSMILNGLLFGILFLGLLILVMNFSSVVDWLNYYFPVTTRVTVLFEDFESAVATGGSGRNVAWNTGIEMIKASPIFGVGVGNYTTISSKILGTGVIAHNSYLQIAAEWGLPLALIFFGTILFLILKIVLKYHSNFNLSVQKDILIILLIGSMGISLNNARFFWLILGAIFTSYKMFIYIDTRENMEV